MALPWRVLDSVPTKEGLLELRQRGDDDFLIVIAGRVLMTSAARRSEEALATLACAKLRSPAPSVLVGGLGMACTLRAALDALPAAARVLVVELVPRVVDWCRGPLARLTGGAIDDPRVTVEVNDVSRTIRAARAGSFHAILLDLYQGPYGDDPLFGATALARAHIALAPGGVFAVWSEEVDPAFSARMRAAGFVVSTHRPGKGGRSHVVYLGVRA